MQIYQRRIQKLQERLSSKDIVVLFSPSPKKKERDIFYPYRSHPHLIYLTGISFYPMALVVEKEKVWVFFERRSPEKARWIGEGIKEEKIEENLGISSKNILPWEKVFPFIKEALKGKEKLYTSLAEEEKWDLFFLECIRYLKPYSRKKEGPPLTLIDADLLIGEMRVYKEKEEVEKIKKACMITRSSIEELKMWLKERISQEKVYEYEVASFLEISFRKKGAEGFSFPPIVASGENATILHYEKNNSLIDPDKLLLIDVGCTYMHYASDLTFTFSPKKEPSSLQKDLLDVVKKAQEDAISSISPKKSSFEDVHQAAVSSLISSLREIGLFKKIYWEDKWIKNPSEEEIFQNGYYKLYYMHQTSHFLGMEVHDVGKYYIEGESRSIEEKMVFTVEPGVYIPREYDFLPEEFRGIGIRLEEDVYIDKKGPVKL